MEKFGHDVYTQFSEKLNSFSKEELIRMIHVLTKTPDNIFFYYSPLMNNFGADDKMKKCYDFMFETKDFYYLYDKPRYLLYAVAKIKSTDKDETKITT